MLLFLYLISVVFSIIIVDIINFYFWERLQEDGIKITFNNSMYENLKDNFLLIIRICIPIFNIINIMYLLSSYKKIYKRLVEKKFLQGEILFDKQKKVY